MDVTLLLDGNTGMSRPWNIAEQVVEDPTTKLRIEFTSVHSIEVSQGRAAPLHDEIIYLRLWTSDRTRVATYAFTRGGQFVKATVEPLPNPHPDPAPAALVQRTRDWEQASEAMNYNEDHPQGPEEPQVFGDINYASQFVGDI